MRTQVPQIRARSIHDWLAYVEKREPGARDQILASIPKASREVIATAVRTEWIDIAHDRHIPKACLEEFGETRATELWQEFIPSHLEAPLFRAVVDGMVRLFGLTPKTFVRMLPRLWAQSFRNVCEIQVHFDTSHKNLARAVLSEVAEEVITWEPYMRSWQAYYSGVFGIVGVKGRTRFALDIDARRIEVEWRW